MCGNIWQGIKYYQPISRTPVKLFGWAPWNKVGRTHHADTTTDMHLCYQRLLYKFRFISSAELTRPTMAVKSMRASYETQYHTYPTNPNSGEGAFRFTLRNPAGKRRMSLRLQVWIFARGTSRARNILPFSPASYRLTSLLGTRPARCVLAGALSTQHAVLNPIP